MRQNLFVRLFVLMAFFAGIIGCQKDQLMPDDVNMENVEQSGNFKSGTNTDYLTSLIEEIEALVNEKELSKGEGNSLIVKIKASIRSINRGNTKSASGQLGALVNEIEEFIEFEVLPEELGQLFITMTENATFLLDGNTFVDSRDGNSYSIVPIGTQLWMGENLAYLPAVSPSSSDSDSSPVYYVYGYEGSDVSEAKAIENYNTYGALYNYVAATNACPDGWHLPSDQEWITLEIELGMDPTEANAGGIRTSGSVGNKLRSEDLWYVNEHVGNNISGLSFPPAGYRDSRNGGRFVSNKSTTYLWSIMNSNSTILGRQFGIGSEGVYRIYLNPYLSAGFSVRCIKD